jgi:GDSL-like Lipase/Acylhydrolase family
MLAIFMARHPRQQHDAYCPPLLRFFAALFVVSSLLGILFLSEESQSLGGAVRQRFVDPRSSLSSFKAAPTSKKPKSTTTPVGDDSKADPQQHDGAAAADDDPARWDDDDELVTNEAKDESAAAEDATDAAAATPVDEFADALQRIRTWADTPKGHGCSRLLPIPPGARSVSPSMVWSLIKERVLNASYYPPLEHGKSDAFRKYVNTIFAFYSAAKLRRSNAHPAPPNTIRRIVALVDAYKTQLERYNNAAAQQGNRTLAVPPPEPIRILVLGGSVTKGTNCLASSEVWLGRKQGTPEWYYAWPARLEHMLNQIFFGTDTVGGSPFKVNNYAMGATNSEVGAAMLENQLIPGLQENPPDIVIVSYSTNDARDPDRNATYHVHLQNLVRAAHNTRPCDDDLPLVIMADDMHGMLDEDPALEITGSLYKLASWYNVMLVAYGNVARHASIASYINITQPNPLLGSPYDNLHHGVGMHIGIAWTIVFNLLSAFQETCSDVVETTDELPVATLDSMKWALVEPPTKYQGRIASIEDASKEWRNRIAWKDQHCPMPATELAPFSTSVCAYAWTVNPVTISEPHHIDEALRPALVDVDGWRADYFNNGTVFRSPGFGTETPNSTFSLELRNVTQPTKHLTIFSMSSYGPGFSNSVLQLKVRIVRSASSSASAKDQKKSNDEATYEVKGSHDLRTSVFFPHKFRLPGDQGAQAGDTIRLDARLVSGKAFKIQAVAFCQS